MFPRFGHFLYLWGLLISAWNYVEFLFLSYWHNALHMTATAMECQCGPTFIQNSYVFMFNVNIRQSIKQLFLLKSDLCFKGLKGRSRHSFLPSFIHSYIHSFIHSIIPSFLPSFLPFFQIWTQKLSTQYDKYEQSPMQAPTPKTPSAGRHREGNAYAANLTRKHPLVSVQDPEGCERLVAGTGKYPLVPLPGAVYRELRLRWRLFRCGCQFPWQRSDWVVPSWAPC
jgi:hypothetical protein